MTTATPRALSARAQSGARQSLVSNGLPDPRPITDYNAVLSTVSGHSRLTITLTQPCVVRQPMWPLIDCNGGGSVPPSSCTAVSTTQFYLDFAGLVAPSVAIVQVPYQDNQVQNFQGGFVRPGGLLFRTPVMPG